MMSLLDMCVLTMWQLVGFFMFCSVLNVRGTVDMIGEGRWAVLDIKLCDDADQYEMQLRCSRNKLNRTHDGFTADIDLKQEINEQDYAIAIDVFKEMDGGFKLYQTMADDSFCNFTRKYAKDNMAKLLAMAGAASGQCPIKPGSYKIEGFIFDYTELNKTGIYGVFQVFAYLIHKLQKIACVCMVLEFKENYN